MHAPRRNRSGRGASGLAPGRRPWAVCARRRSLNGPSVRTGPACAIHSAFASTRQPWSTSISGSVLADRVAKGLSDVGQTHHPNSKVVVAVSGMVVVAVSTARVVAVVVPGAAAHHAPGRIRPPHRLAPASPVSLLLSPKASSFCERLTCAHFLFDSPHLDWTDANEPKKNFAGAARPVKAEKRKSDAAARRQRSRRSENQ